VNLLQMPGHLRGRVSCPSRWRVSEGLFSMLARNARPLDAYFRIPPSQVFEVGAQFDL
jgi:K+ transporter